MFRDYNAEILTLTPPAVFIVWLRGPRRGGEEGRIAESFAFLLLCLSLVILLCYKINFIYFRGSNKKLNCIRSSLSTLDIRVADLPLFLTVCRLGLLTHSMSSLGLPLVTMTM